MKMDLVINVIKEMLLILLCDYVMLVMLENTLIFLIKMFTGICRNEIS